MLENLHDLDIGLGMPVTFSRSDHDETGHYKPIAKRAKRIHGESIDLLALKAREYRPPSQAGAGVGQAAASASAAGSANTAFRSQAA